MGLDPCAGLWALPLRLPTTHYLRARQYLRNFDVRECRNDTFINQCPYRFRALQPVGGGIRVDDIQQSRRESQPNVRIAKDRNGTTRRPLSDNLGFSP